MVRLNLHTKMQPERLADQLYKMLRDLGKEIKKKDGCIEESFLFMSLFEENAVVSEKYKSNGVQGATSSIKKQVV